MTEVDQGDFVLDKYQSISSNQRETVQIQRASHPLPNDMIITEDSFLKASEGIEYAKKASSLIMSTTVIEEEVTQLMPHQVKSYIMQKNNYYPFQTNNTNQLNIQAIREKFPNYFHVKEGKRREEYIRMRQLWYGTLNMKSPGPTETFRNIKHVRNEKNYVSVLTPLGMMNREPTLPARYYNEETKEYAVVCLEFRMERTAEDLETLMKIYELMNESEVRHPRSLEKHRKMQI